MYKRQEYTCGAIAGIDRYIVKGVILSVKDLGKVIVCLGISYLDVYKRQPHREAVLSAKRTVVNKPNRNTPKACEASTNNRPANSMGSIPLLQG